jgi:pyruvate formate lyase activating enzyme
LDSLFVRKIDYKKCTGCDKCIQICPAGALQKVGRLMTPREVLAEVIKDRIFYRKTNGGVTISGGEPLYQYDFFMGLLEEFKAAFLNVVVETTGYTSWENLEGALPLIDIVLYDFKHINSKKHRLFTGVDNSLIIENLKKLGEADVQVWLRMPIIPGYNDSLEDIENTTDLIKNIKNIQKVELLPYHKLGNSKYSKLGMIYKLKDLEPPPEEELKEIESIFKSKLPWLEVQIGG